MLECSKTSKPFPLKPSDARLTRLGEALSLQNTERCTTDEGVCFYTRPVTSFCRLLLPPLRVCLFITIFFRLTSIGVITMTGNAAHFFLEKVFLGGFCQVPPQLFSNTKHSLGHSVLTPRSWLPLPISLRVSQQVPQLQGNEGSAG